RVRSSAHVIHVEEAHVDAGRQVGRWSLRGAVQRVDRNTGGAIDPALDLHAALDTTTQPVLGPELGDELDIRRGVQQVDPASAVGGDCGPAGEEPDTPAAY